MSINERSVEAARMLVIIGGLTADNDALATDLARVTAERDRLIERWPDGINANHVGWSFGRGWIANCGDGTGLQLEYREDRTEAVRFAAGLHPEPKGYPE